MAAKALLEEVGLIMDELGVPFFLRQGTCLGAIRDKALIPWDDDLDIGSIIGSLGVAEVTIDRAVSAFREAGFFVRVDRTDQQVGVSMMKSSTRVDWTCYRVIDGTIAHYPGIRMPVDLFLQLKEVDFLDSKFFVPNPPEEYLRCKYGPDWMTPKRVGFEQDVLDLVRAAPARGSRGRLRQLLRRVVARADANKLRVFDSDGEQVVGAEAKLTSTGRIQQSRPGGHVRCRRNDPVRHPNDKRSPEAHPGKEPS